MSAEVTDCKGGDGCCAKGCKYPDDSDCSKSCGDGVVDPPELCEPSSAEKPCPTNCDDKDPCTNDLQTGTPAQCNVVCTHTPVTAAESGDGCCPSGANIANDSDCEAACGDGVVSDGETCDPKSSSMPCPTSCDDDNACTRDMVTGEASRCTVQCAHAPIGVGAQNECGGCRRLEHAPGSPCAAGERACAGRGEYECQGTDTTECNAQPNIAPESCDGKDNDCDGKNDEGVMNACGGCGSVPAEVCDGADNDCDGKNDEGVKNACGGCGSVPAEVCDGADNDCDSKNDEGVKNACGGCGNVPAEACDGIDNDCDSKTDEGVMNACGGCGPCCGDGTTQGSEECDAGGKETWECDRSCRKTRVYTACSSSLDCRNGQSCTNGACTEICTQQANGSFACPSSDIPEGALGVICYLEAADFGYCRPRCSGDQDCPSGLRCVDNVCMP